MKLHTIDGFDEVEEGVSACGFVWNFACGAISGIKDGIILEVVENVAINVEFLGAGHAEAVE